MYVNVMNPTNHAARVWGASALRARASRSGSRRSRRGLSIVEVMISLTISAFLLVAVAAAYNASADAVEMNELMFYSSLKTGDSPGNSMASIVKMRGTEVGQKITELAVEAVGWYGVPFTELRNYDSNIVPVGGEYVDDVAPRYFNNRKTTIYGGSSEVQRNVLAKAMLGL